MVELKLSIDEERIRELVRNEFYKRGLIPGPAGIYPKEPGEYGEALDLDGNRRDGTDEQSHQHEWVAQYVDGKFVRTYCAGGCGQEREDATDGRYRFCEICKGLANHETSKHPWPSRTDGESPTHRPIVDWSRVDFFRVEYRGEWLNIPRENVVAVYGQREGD